MQTATDKAIKHQILTMNKHKRVFLPKESYLLTKSPQK